MTKSGVPICGWKREHTTANDRLVLTVRTERSKAVKIVFYYFLVCGIAAAMYSGAVKAKKNEKRLLSYLCYFGVFLVILFFI